MEYFLGIDLGTSSVKSILTDAAGRVQGCAQEEYSILKERTEYAEQDMEELWQAAKRTIRSVLSAVPGAAEGLRGIGLSGQQHGLVMVDREGRLLRNAIIWSDQRTAEEIQDIYRVIPRQEYQSVTLNALSTGFLIVSLLWVKKREPELFERVHKVMLPKDYIRYRLCGEIGTEASDASAAVIFDTVKRDWAWELIDRLGFARELFPACSESFQIAGEVHGACEAETGLRKGTRVVYGGGDTPMQALGNGMTGEGTLAANVGTACQVSSVLERPLYDPLFRTNTFCYTKKDRWMIMGANLSGGVVLKWLKNQVLGMSSYEEMTEAGMQSTVGSNGLIFLPYLNGERTPYQNPHAKAVYFGLTLRHDRTDMIRAAMEGIVLGMWNSIGILRGIGVQFHHVIASGGASRSPLFTRILADVFGKEIYLNENQEQAGMGAAIAAAVGTEAFSTVEEACTAMVHLNPEPILPNAENHQQYQEIFQKYCALYEQNKEFF